ncbi:MAG: DUF1223 domain-containing protein [Gammaproteobacteria bacterium]|nr:DUF1223 domain-containing protein [Gammaproteobacteria bacterium]
MPLLKTTLLLSLLLPTALLADSVSVKSGLKQTAVLELYTSEGCNSCPPADNWLAQLVQVQQDELDVLALAFHVDYWDYLGWKDEFASPDYSQRQRELGMLNRQRTIYTPEFFVDGREVRGTGNVIEQIRRANQTTASVDLELSLEVDASQLEIRLLSQDKSEQAAQVQFVVFEDHLANQVERGENAGRELKHQRVVRYLSPQRRLQPELQHSISLDPEWKRQDLGIAALVTSPRQEYLQAVYSRLP